MREIRLRPVLHLSLISLAPPSGQLARIQQQQTALLGQTIAILMQITEAVQVIGKIETTLGKVSAEQSDLVADLRAALEAKGEIPAAIEQGLARLEQLSAALDEIVPDKVTPEGPAPTISEVPADGTA